MINVPVLLVVVEFLGSDEDDDAAAALFDEDFLFESLLLSLSDSDSEEPERDDRMVDVDEDDEDEVDERGESDIGAGTSCALAFILSSFSLDELDEPIPDVPDDDESAFFSTNSLRSSLATASNSSGLRSATAPDEEVTPAATGFLLTINEVLFPTWFIG
jgi:hypothetical protein